MLANTLYITPIWAQGVQLSESAAVAATQTNDDDITELDINDLVHQVGGLWVTATENENGEVDLDVAKGFEAWFTIDREGDNATVTFGERASQFIGEMGTVLGKDAADSFFYSSIASGFADKGFEGSVVFKNFDGTDLGGANIKNGSATITNTKGQELYTIDPLVAGNMPVATEQSNSGIVPGPTGSSSSSVPKQSQGSVSSSGVFQGK